MNIFNLYQCSDEFGDDGLDEEIKSANKKYQEENKN